MALLAVVGTACTDGPDGRRSRPTIAFLFDGAPADSELVTAPALAGLELAAQQAGTVDIEPVNLGVDRTEATRALEDLTEDPAIAAAIVAPWTSPPSGAIDLLAAQGLPVVSLSWAWGPPATGDGLWVSLAADRAHEAVRLLSTADVGPSGAPLCLAGDAHPTSRALLETVEELGRAAGEPDLVVAGIASDAGTATAVAGRIEDAGCPVLLWTGGATEAAAVLSRLPGTPSLVVGTSRIGTDDGLALATPERDVITVSAREDVTLSLELAHTRFVHDLQAESGAPPGPYTVEAYDVGRLLAGLVAGTPRGDLRRVVAGVLGDLADLDGLTGIFRFAPDGSRRPDDLEVGAWRASGSRWLPVERPTVAPA